MKIIKDTFLILLLIIMGLIIVGTVFGPIIISAVTGNWLALFLYFVVAAALWAEIALFITILGLLSYRSFH